MSHLQINTKEIYYVAQTGADNLLGIIERTNSIHWLFGIVRKGYIGMGRGNTFTCAIVLLFLHVQWAVENRA